MRNKIINVIVEKKKKKRERESEDNVEKKRGVGKEKNEAKLGYSKNGSPSSGNIVFYTFRNITERLL